MCANTNFCFLKMDAIYTCKACDMRAMRLLKDDEWMDGCTTKDIIVNVTDQATCKGPVRGVYLPPTKQVRCIHTFVEL